MCIRDSFSISDTFSAMSAQGYTRIFNTDVNASGFFLKQILGGAFITIAMTGLDQEMMQKNISVKTLGGSQKNVLTLATVLLIVNVPVSYTHLDVYKRQVPGRRRLPSNRVCFRGV